jgi:hypothetical protein
VVAETDLEAARDDLRRIEEVLQRILGLESRWNGTLEILDTYELLYGKKRVSCTICLRADVLSGQGALRWREMIHELLHALSVGYSLAAWRDFRVWEEGAVEKLQRLLRGQVLQGLGIELDEALEAEFRRLDAESEYNGYVQRLEQYQETLGMPPNEFYPWLLNMPLAERASTVAHLYEQKLREGGRAPNPDT